MLLSPENGQALQSLQWAEAAVAAHIGAASLETRQVSVSGFLRSSAFVHLEDGPLTGVASLVVSGALALPVFSTYWHLELAAQTSGPYALAYTAGWTLSTLPPKIESAIRMTAQSFESRPDASLVSESMGPVSRSWSAGGGSTIPTHLHSLLEPWVRLRI